MNNNGISTRLIIMNFLQYAIWGAYLTSMGSYLYSIGLGPKIGIFYAMQGIVSIFMPAIIGIIADKFIQAQKVLSICHGIAGIAMIAAGYYGFTAGNNVDLDTLFSIFRTGKIWNGHGESLPSYQGVRNSRIHLQHVVRKLHDHRWRTVPAVL